MTLHVVGNICLDTTYYVPRFPRPGETMLAESSRPGLCGKGLNQAFAAARAGARVRLHAAVGVDRAAFFRNALEDEPNLQLDAAELDLPSDESTILVRSDGENAIVSAAACAKAYDPLAVGFGSAVEAGDIVLLQGNLRPEVTAACLAHARRRSAVTILNPSPLWDGEAPPWALVDLVVVNGGELHTLTGFDDRRGAAALRQYGAGAVVVTLGSEGALMGDHGGWLRATAPAVEVMDTSGAGDVFCGILAGLLAQGVERGSALARATAASALSVTRVGAFDSCPSAAEIRALDPKPPSRRPS